MTRSDGPPAGGSAPHEAVERAAEVLGGRAQLSAPLGARTTYRVGGPAAVLVEARSLDDLGAVAAAHRASGLPVLAVGRGSNLLVADRGFAGIAVVLDPAEDAFGWVDLSGRQVSAGAAVALPTLARRSVEAGLTGFEWAVGVPGSIGGAVRMNAGGHGSDMARAVLSAGVVDLTAAPGPDGAAAVRDWSVSDLGYGYRRSALGPTDVVVAARLGLGPGDPAGGRATIRAIVTWRREHQPGGQNAGSVFTNPPAAPEGWSAGRLIEAAGLKGSRHGSAEVSPKHANFIQADPGGSADDVDALMAEVQAAVRRRFGVELTTEIRRIGFPNPQPLVER